MRQRYLTLKQLSVYLGIPYGTLRNHKCYAPEKLPPHVVVPLGKGQWRFDIEAVDRWLNNNADKGCNPLFFNNSISFHH